MICDAMKWDYLLLEKQPSWFIECMIDKLQLDRHQEEVEARKAQRRRQ